MTKKEKSIEVRTVVRTQSKRISLWRRLGIQWKPILKELGLACSPATLANHHNNRGLI